MRLANEGELILTWSRLQAPSGYTWNELGVLPNICTPRSATPSKLGTASVDSNQGQLMRWHALRNPTPQEVTDLRKICPPGDDRPGGRRRSRRPPAARPHPLCPRRAGGDLPGRRPPLAPIFMGSSLTRQPC